MTVGQVRTVMFKYSSKAWEGKYVAYDEKGMLGIADHPLAALKCLQHKPSKFPQVFLFYVPFWQRHTFKEIQLPGWLGGGGKPESMLLIQEEVMIKA